MWGLRKGVGKFSNLDVLSVQNEAIFGHCKKIFKQMIILKYKSLRKTFFVWHLKGLCRYDRSLPVSGLRNELSTSYWMCAP